MTRMVLATGLAACGLAVWAANPLAQAPPAQTAESLFGQLRWRNLGPANMSGRVSDIEAVEANPAIVYVGSGLAASAASAASSPLPAPGSGST